MPGSLLIAAHPDDETIGLGGQLHAFTNLRIVHVTDGAPRDPRDAAAKGFSTREEYARARQRELAAALRVAGLEPGLARSLGIVDQEASLDLAGLALRVAGLIREMLPEVVYTHPYEGGHPDHDACAFAVHTACGLLDAPPAIREFTSYHGRGGAMVTGEFRGNGVAATVLLSREARDRKRRMLGCFATQRETLRAFGCDSERLRAAPRYDFRRRPSEEVFYDRFQWGISSQEWVERARKALAALGVPAGGSVPRGER
jgi:LmbE family N-acetylglucosaminyl deacetylase